MKKLINALIRKFNELNSTDSPSYEKGVLARAIEFLRHVKLDNSADFSDLNNYFIREKMWFFMDPFEELTNNLLPQFNKLDRESAPQVYDFVFLVIHIGIVAAINNAEKLDPKKFGEIATLIEQGTLNISGVAHLVVNENLLEHYRRSMEVFLQNNSGMTECEMLDFVPDFSNAAVADADEGGGAGAEVVVDSIPAFVTAETADADSIPTATVAIPVADVSANPDFSNAAVADADEGGGAGAEVVADSIPAFVTADADSIPTATVATVLTNQFDSVPHDFDHALPTVGVSRNAEAAHEEEPVAKRVRKDSDQEKNSEENFFYKSSANSFANADYVVNSEPSIVPVLPVSLVGRGVGIRMAEGEVPRAGAGDESVSVDDEVWKRFFNSDELNLTESFLFEIDLMLNEFTREFAGALNPKGTF